MVFHQADRLLVTDIYAASEEPIPGIGAEALAADLERVLELALGLGVEPEPAVDGGDHGEHGQGDGDCPGGFACRPDPAGAHEGSFCQPATGSCSCHPGSASGPNPGAVTSPRRVTGIATSRIASATVGHHPMWASAASIGSTVHWVLSQSSIEMATPILFTAVRTSSARCRSPTRWPPRTARA